MHSEEFDIGLGNNDSSIRASAKNDYISFWDNCAKSLSWFKPWTKTLQWDPPFARWFVGGKINASYNTLDIHQDSKSEKPAIVFLNLKSVFRLQIRPLARKHKFLV